MDKQLGGGTLVHRQVFAFAFGGLFVREFSVHQRLCVARAMRLSESGFVVEDDRLGVLAERDAVSGDEELSCQGGSGRDEEELSLVGIQFQVLGGRP